MAEIPVEKKSSLGWLWLLLALLVLALLAWWLLSGDEDVAMVEDEAVMVQDADSQSVVGNADEMTLAAILANPSAYIGREDFNGEVATAGPLTDRGFWIEKDGSRMFAILNDAPSERPLDINPGQMLQINGGRIVDASTITADGIDGDPLDQDTMNVLSDQEAVMIIDESSIDIIESA
ncbi:hypothetical protein [Erythrobacter sp.]|jgi:hypothetical protein|uniref:hypothetical protein n=1 Tax=Erythrobacter sp. TaxID=1042 RepID=UPI002EAA4154|nr:hypothetical protein [Erythrobacter sp.]